MKCFYKTRTDLLDNSGETMVEVIVAFTLLSIMLVMFTQGITWASKSELNASRVRKESDEAFADVQSRLASGERDSSYQTVSNAFNDRIKREKITCEGSDGRIYTYIYYEAFRTQGG